jgi:UrcA family protein
MKKNRILAVSAAIGGATLALATSASAQELDSFAIEVTLADIATEADAQRFEDRLYRTAFSYCREEAPWASRDQLETCQVSIVDAVQEQIEADARASGMSVAWAQ